MNYRRERFKAKLDKYYVARELGIHLKEYNEVESGRRSLAGKFMDKFLQLVDPENKNYINYRTELAVAMDWAKSTDLGKLAAEFKVSQLQIADKIGIHGSQVCRVLNGTADCTPNMAMALYDFFHNDMNRQHKLQKRKMKKYKKKTGKLPDIGEPLVDEPLIIDNSSTVNNDEPLIINNEPLVVVADNIDEEIVEDAPIIENTGIINEGIVENTINEEEESLLGNGLQEIFDQTISCIEENLEDKIIMLQDRITELELQVRRYEKLIDLI